MQLCKLPNGTEISCISHAEALLLYEDIYRDQSYLKNGVTIQEGDVVVDVGANIGLFLLFAHQCAPSVMSYACEPIPPIFEVLTANVSSHKLPTRLFNVGISRERGDAEFTYYKHNSALSGRYADPGDEHRLAKTILSNKKPNLKEKHLDALLTDKFESERFQCSLVTLSSIIQEDRIERIDLLKVDVEKSEADVFAGIVDPHWARIRQVVVEVHDHEGRLSTITTLLRGKGFEVVAVQNPSFKGTDIYDVYAVRPS